MRVCGRWFTTLFAYLAALSLAGACDDGADTRSDTLSVVDALDSASDLLPVDGVDDGSSPDTPESNDSSADADEGESPRRQFALSASGARLELEPDVAIRLRPVDLSDDVDVVWVHQEFYGLPWLEFETGAQPPAEWVAEMDAIAAHAKSVGPVYLSLSVLSGGARRHLSDRTVINAGKVTTEGEWSAECYDFSTAPDGAQKQAAYVAYVEWMVERFEPRWVNVATEMNMFAPCGESAWNALVEVERAAYDAAKAVDPTVVAFPTIQIDFLYGWVGCAGDRESCYEANYMALANIKRDRFAVTSFPYLIEALRDPDALPDDWFNRAGDRGGEETIIGEVGWLGEPLVVELDGQCLTAIPADESTQLRFFERVLEATRANDFELVVWATNRDLIETGAMSSCPCDFDSTWCDFLSMFRGLAGADPNAQADMEYGLKVFGAMGIRRYDGTPRPALKAAWDDARSLPWAAAP